MPWTRTAGVLAACTLFNLAPALLVPAAAQSPLLGLMADQWDRFGFSAIVHCRDRPVLLVGNHQDLTVSGACGYVRVAGEHNDIDIAMAPGGTIEITGAHNDVTWHVPPGTRPPRLLNNGESNDFHAGG